jgi:hypothetical protein
MQAAAGLAGGCRSLVVPPRLAGRESRASTGRCSPAGSLQRVTKADGSEADLCSARDALAIIARQAPS